MSGQPAAGDGDVLAMPCSLDDLWAVRHGQSTAGVAFAEAARIEAARTESASTEAARSGAADLPVDGRDADVELSAQGHAEAAALGRWLTALDDEGRPDLVVCSPYRRARQTWAGMADTAVRNRVEPPPTLVDERLRDRDMGIFELHPPAAIEARSPREAERRARLGEWAYRPPGGEALADVALRVRDFLTQLDRVAPRRRVLLVAHDAVVTSVRYVLAGLGAAVPDDLPPVPNASVSHWSGDAAQLRLASWASTTHLTGMEPTA
jgi:2,3-bisphosphoglycerate-dependent phosphoglycerate mutase